MLLPRLPGPITGNLEADLGLLAFAIAIVVALRVLDKNRRREAKWLGVSLGLALTSVVLFIDAVNGTNALYANTPVDPARAAAGKTVYEQYCSACHGETGHGDGPTAAGMPIKPLDLTVHIFQHDQGYFILAVGGGMGPMPAFKDKLSRDEIENVIDYVRLLGYAARSKP
ncbi:MAG: cytochrome c [Chloroflexi bacterium]|nr:cytochrome c [Chloroflexota bacterium]